MKLTIPILMICGLLFYSCEDNSTPSPAANNNNGGGGNNTTSINSAVNLLTGKWRVDSVWMTNPTFGSGIISYYNGTEITLTNNLQSSSINSNCFSNTYHGFTMDLMYGNVVANNQGTWKVLDMLSSCATGGVPSSHRILLNTPPTQAPIGGYIEFLGASKLVTVHSTVPLQLPNIPSGASANRCYLSRIP